jgi:site-specific recombinase XerD
MGYLPFNAGAAIHRPTLEQKLAKRILSERQVFALLEAVEDRPRDHALIRLLYNGGLRVSELVTLRWRNLVEGVANVTGKGGKTRVVRPSRGTWAELQALRSDETIGEDFVFPMSAVNAWKRVKRAARLAGISEVPVSPHFPAPLTRHACLAPRRRSGDRARHARSCLDRDDQPLSARPTREVQRRLPRAVIVCRRLYNLDG